MDGLSIDELKELANKSRKTYQRANTVIFQRIEEQKQDLLQASKCALCIHGKIDTVLVPCGHVSQLQNLLWEAKEIFFENCFGFPQQVLFTI